LTQNLFGEIYQANFCCVTDRPSVCHIPTVNSTRN